MSGIVPDCPVLGQPSGIKTEAIPDMHLSGISDLLGITSEFLAFYFRLHQFACDCLNSTVEIGYISLFIISFCENQVSNISRIQLITMEVSLV